jgi:hypothetical protein
MGITEIILGLKTPAKGISGAENGSQQGRNGQNRWNNLEVHEKWARKGFGKPIFENLRSFAVHFGLSGGFGWPKMPILTANGRKWTQMGAGIA